MTSEDVIICLGIKQQAPANILSKTAFWNETTELFHHPAHFLYSHHTIKGLTSLFPAKGKKAIVYSSNRSHIELSIVWASVYRFLVFYMSSDILVSTITVCSSVCCK